MCVLGNEIETINVLKKNHLTGFRNWLLNFKTEEVKSLNGLYIWIPKKIATGNIEEMIETIPMGIYYNYNNYNNYNYNNNYYNYYNYYNYNYYNNYNFTGLCQVYGKVVKHEKGFRSTKAYPKLFVTLTNHEDKKFLEHFNTAIETAAKKFGIPTMDYDKFVKEYK